MTTSDELLHIYVELQPPTKADKSSHLHTLQELKDLLLNLKDKGQSFNSLNLNLVNYKRGSLEIVAYLEALAGLECFMTEEFSPSHLSFKFTNLQHLKQGLKSASKIISTTSSNTEVTLQVLEDDETQKMSADDLYATIQKNLDFLNSTHKRRRIVTDYLISPLRDSGSRLEAPEEFHLRNINQGFQLTNILVNYISSTQEVSVREQLQFWKSYLEGYLTSSQVRDILVPAFEKRKGLLGSVGLLVSEDKIYFQPEAYSSISQPINEYQLTLDNEERFLEKKSELENLGFEYSYTTEECSTCPLLLHCVQRGTLGVMKAIEERSCVYPEKLRQVFMP